MYYPIKTQNMIIMVMAQFGCSSHSTERLKKAAVAPQCFWTHYEEQALIATLKNLRAGGWHCDGSFKGGYIVRLETMLVQKFFDGAILVKHIKSKLQVNPDAAKLRGKPYPWYDSWVEIFGNDSATCEQAFDVADII